MGKYNSSVTRVWPVFDHLFHLDSTGKKWLPQLLNMAPFQNDAIRHKIETPCFRLANLELDKFTRKLPGPLKRAIGNECATKLGNIRAAFEVDLPPPYEFLRWLLEHPDEMAWPKRGKKTTTFGKNTQSNRNALIKQRDEDTQKLALEELDQARTKKNGFRRKWWAFEGFTSVDCLLETDDLIVIVEGKRTEPISSSTNWYPQRNQIIRNLECAKTMANGKKEYAVLICAENSVTIPDNAWEKSLPHFTPTERSALREHFLGCVKWSDICSKLCGTLKLPQNIDAAVATCEKYRPNKKCTPT